jgi:hypothetical protein
MGFLPRRESCAGIYTVSVSLLNVSLVTLVLVPDLVPYVHVSEST